MQVGKEYTIPNWAICYLVNGDHSGLSEEEYQTITEFEESTGHLILGDDLGFCHNNDVDRYASDCHQMFTLVD